MPWRAKPNEERPGGAIFKNQNLLGSIDSIPTDGEKMKKKNRDRPAKKIQSDKNRNRKGKVIVKSTEKEKINFNTKPFMQIIL